MKDKLLHIIRTKPAFLFLLPPFFVLHGSVENFDFIPVKDALLLTLIYLAFSMLIAGLCWIFYRNFTKANLVALCIMGFNFFFGTMHDWLRKIFPGTIVTKYIFILPAALMVFILLIVLLKKTKKPLLKLSYFLNLLFLVLLLTDGSILVWKLISREKFSYTLPPGFTNCDNCSKPDLYFILADEYAGNTELKDIFQFDDSAFLNQLSARNFHVIPESHSNYNYTPFSVASILNMDYLDLQGKYRNQPQLAISYETIRDNQLLRFLQAQQYKFYNFSVFDFEGQPARVRETFLPVKTRLITAQTFLRRFDKEIRFNMVERLKSKKDLKKLTYDNKNNNENIYQETWDIALEKTGMPKFVYTHLMMPHYPYYYDRNGNEQPFEKLVDGNQGNKEAYISYLQYSNKRLLELVDHILRSSEKPPIIVLMGDHGFRHFTTPVAAKYYFLNLASVYLPEKNYAGFSDSLNAVNFFRTVLNVSFQQKLPYLKDSTSYLAD